LDTRIIFSKLLSPLSVPSGAEICLLETTRRQARIFSKTQAADNALAVLSLRGAISVEIIIGFGGVLLGFILSEISTWMRERKSEQQQAEATRTLLSLEIEQNLVLLRSFWERVSKAKEGKEDEEEITLLITSAIADRPLPSWSHRAWESQMGVLPQAISSHAILGQIHTHHTELDAIAAIRENIFVLRKAPLALVGVNVTFAWNAPALCAECERIVTELLSIGNPIPQDKRAG
jgi:hypothetical protein